MSRKVNAAFRAGFIAASIRFQLIASKALNPEGDLKGMSKAQRHEYLKVLNTICDGSMSHRSEVAATRHYLLTLLETARELFEAGEMDFNGLETLEQYIVKLAEDVSPEDGLAGEPATPLPGRSQTMTQFGPEMDSANCPPPKQEWWKLSGFQSLNNATKKAKKRIH